MRMLWALSLRNLTVHWRRTLVLGGAIAAVSMVLVCWLGASQSLERRLVGTVAAVGGGHLEISGLHYPPSGRREYFIPDVPALEKVVRKALPELRGLTVRGQRLGSIVSSAGTRGAWIRGVDATNDPRLMGTLRAAEGSLDVLKDPGAVVIGSDLAKVLRLHLYDTVTLMGTTLQGELNSIDLEVRAIFEPQGGLTANQVYLAMASHSQLFGQEPTTSNALMLYFDSPEVAFGAEPRLRAALEQAGYAVVPEIPRQPHARDEIVHQRPWEGMKLNLTRWDDAIQSVRFPLDVVRAVGAGFSVVLMLFIVFGVLNNLWILIDERTVELGTLRALGMQRREVLVLIVLEVLSLSLFSVLVGVASAFGLAWGLSVVEVTLPASLQNFFLQRTVALEPDIFSVLFAGGGVCLVTTFFSIFPARRAGRIPPRVAMSALE